MGGGITDSTVELVPGRTLGWFMDRISPEPTSGCWIWTMSGGPGGYARIHANGRMVNVVHLFCRYYNGNSPSDRPYVCHRCDNPTCLNPHHLFWGSQRDNIHDAVRKGRMVYSRGAKNGSTKLREEDAKRIVVMREDGMTYRKIAAFFNVSKGAITEILSGENWSYATGIEPNGRRIQVKVKKQAKLAGLE